MDKSERRMQYLEVYRQQLRHELDEVGYGQSKGDTYMSDRQARKNSSSSLVVIAVALAVLSVISAQI